MRLALVLFSAAAFAQSTNFEARVVEDSSGNPLATAEVRIRKIGVRELAADLDTNREGIVRAAGLPAARYTIEISKPNYVTASLKVDLPATGLLVRLVRHAIFSGQVTDSNGQPALGRISAAGGRTIGGARIGILAKTPTGFRKVREVELAENGRYRIHDLPPGEYTVALWYDGLKDGSGVMMLPDLARPRIFTVAGGEEFRDIDFQLTARPAFQVTGTVQLPKPKTRVALALGLAEQPLLPIAQTVTNGTDGAFRFERVPAGTYDLYVAGPDEGYGAHASLLGPEPFFARARVAVVGANVSGLDITVAPGRTLPVKLAGDRPEGCPASVPVTVEPLEPWGILPGRPTQVSFGKEDVLRHLTPGRIRLNAGDLGPNCYQPEPTVVDLSGDAPGPAALRLASAGVLRGVFPAAGYTVVLLESDSSTNPQARLATPDTAGKFTFDGLPPGRYRIAARPNSADAKSRWIADVSRMIEIHIPGGTPTDIELPAPPAGGRQ